MTKRKTHEEFISQLSNVNDSIKVIGKYITCKTKIEVTNIKCGHKWSARPNDLLRGKNCPTCAGKRITTDVFKERIKEKFPDVVVCGEYKLCNERIRCYCNIHNEYFYQTPDKFYAGSGCQKCGVESSINLRKFSKSQFIEKLNKTNPNIELIGKFTKLEERTHFKCKVCNHEWEVIPRSLFNFGCPKCAGNAIKTTEEFENELKSNAPNFKLLSPYIRSNKKVHIICNDCRKDDWVTPNKLQGGQQCKYCNETKGEKFIRYFIESYNIKCISQKSFSDLKGIGDKSLSYDFYLPTYNLLIEYQGEQHEYPVTFGGKTKNDAEKAFEKQQEHDKRKREYAHSNSINLLEIWYYDFYNIEEILTKALDINTL